MDKKVYSSKIDPMLCKIHCKQSDKLFRKLVKLYPSRLRNILKKLSSIL